MIDDFCCVILWAGWLAGLIGSRHWREPTDATICDIWTSAYPGPALHIITRTAHPCLPQSTNRVELASSNTRMSRILQAWIIISAALLSASVVATRQDEVDDEKNEAVVPNQIAPHPQRPMQFVTTDEVMNRFGDNSRFGGLRGSSSSPPSLLSSSLPQHYIINGQTAAAGRYTWFAQAYTKVNGGFYLGGCGAVLIARRWIATAAHCVDGAIQPTHFEVGTYCPPPYSFENCEQEREFGKVKRRYLHEEWGISLDGGPINDIALFQLEDPIESVEPIEMDTGAMDLSHGSDLKAIGIGVTNQMTGERASVLQEVGMRYVSKKQCKDLFRGAFRESQMICAFEENKGTCSGDSGTIVSVGLSSLAPGEWFSVHIYPMANSKHLPTLLFFC